MAMSAGLLVWIVDNCLYFKSEMHLIVAFVCVYVKQILDA